MAKLEAHDEIIETMVDYSLGLRNKKTAPIELARLSGLDLDVAKALLKGQTIRTATELRGYSKEKPYQIEGKNKKRLLKKGAC